MKEWDTLGSLDQGVSLLGGLYFVEENQQVVLLLCDQLHHQILVAAQRTSVHDDNGLQDRDKLGAFPNVGDGIHDFADLISIAS